MKYFGLLLFLISFSVSANSVVTVEWGTDEWNGFTDQDGTGFYHDLMNQIFPSPKFNLEVSYFPWKRSIKHLSQADIDMTGGMPQSPDFYQSKKPVLSEKILLVSIDKLHAEDLEHKLGAYRAGYDDVIFYAALPDNVAGIEVKDVEQGLALLTQGKVDFYIDTEILISRVFGENISKGDMQTSEVGYFELYWSFAKNEKGKRLKYQFDNTLDQLDKSGMLRSLYDKYDIAMPF